MERRNSHSAEVVHPTGDLDQPQQPDEEKGTGSVRGACPFFFAFFSLLSLWFVLTVWKLGADLSGRLGVHR